MADKIICEKCGAEMLSIDQDNPVGMSCPNCGWGWATTYIEPIIEDPTIYKIILNESNSISTDNIKTVSEISNVNFIEAKQIIEKAPYTILTGNALQIRDTLKILSSTDLDYTITPDFPYLKVQTKMIDETIKDILSRREKTHPEDSYRIEKLWEEEIAALSQNIEETIDFFKSRCSANEFIWLSEVFEEVAEKTQSIEFVNCLYDVAKNIQQKQKNITLSTSLILPRI